MCRGGKRGAFCISLPWGNRFLVSSPQKVRNTPEDAWPWADEGHLGVHWEVSEVRRDGPAAAYGSLIEAGDVLIEIDGRKALSISASMLQQLSGRGCGGI